ncbi:MAG: translation elongation factor 4 [bacterium]
MKNIRNFCIIAHIDHGKSTLADRLLEYTGTVEKRKMKEQLLDQMDLERERGITIKLTPARMNYRLNGEDYVLNLIDTPGHVDFNYEVSRSLAAVEGALLLVDATQGIQAQTLANLYLALDQNLVVIPVLNKIDLPAADLPARKREIIDLIGCSEEEILLASAKTGEGIPIILETIIKQVPAPQGNSEAPLSALIFDSHYDDYRGVVAEIRVVDGCLKKGDKVVFYATQTEGEALEVGYFKPNHVEATILEAGEIGYAATGLRDLDKVRVGDTLTLKGRQTNQPLQGYREVKPMVYAGIFPKEGDSFENLREALAKLRLNDAALVYEPERSTALGFGFRAGLLGLLHLEIVKERLEREYHVPMIVTTPSVAYRVTLTNGEVITAKGAADFMDPSRIQLIEEPWVKADIIARRADLGGIMGLVQEKRGLYKTTEFLDAAGKGERVILHYELPLSSIITDFYDKLKGVTSGYASLSYEVIDLRPADVIRLDILVAEEPVEALATLTYRDEAERVGRKIIEALKTSLPREQFAIKLQAAIGAKIIASDRISPYRKDVTGYLSGGDVTRKRKLLEKQKKGKKKMMERGAGKVEIPTEAFLKVLKS